MKHLHSLCLLMVCFAIQATAQWVPTFGGGGGAVRAMVTNGTDLYAGVDNTGISMSTNGGTTWNAVNSGLPASPSVGALFRNGSTLFAGVSTHGIYSSTNGGTNWNASSSGLTNNFIRAFALLGANLYAATYGGVFVSTNNGVTWSASNTGLTNPTIMSLGTVGTTLLAGTDGGGIFVSTNSGATWAVSNTGFPSPATTTVHCFMTLGANVYAGYGRGVVVSTNNGASWSTVNTGFPNATINVQALLANGTDLYAATSGSGVFRSTNNGQNWAAINTGLSNTTVMSLAAVGPNLFAGTFGSGVWRLLFPTDVRESPVAFPNTFTLSQNYPNPFNPATKIDFALSQPGMTTLTIYNMLGQHVASLVNGELKAGSYSVAFDAANLSSGLYLYKLTSGSFTATRKMMLMK